jgi:type II secretory pathway pseudopilin PulG
MKKNTYKKKYGFSLIETLIAVSILMIAIAGPLSLVQAGLFSSVHQRNQVTAIYLAQEAFEYIKNVRDTNAYTQYGASPKGWLIGPDGSTSLLDTCGTPSGNPTGCYVDPHGTLSGNLFVQSASTAIPANDLYLNQNTAGGILYGYGSGGTVSPYKRTVKITPIVATDEVIVSVIIEWKDGTVSRKYTVSENIYNYHYE